MAKLIVATRPTWKTLRDRPAQFVFPNLHRFTTIKEEERLGCLDNKNSVKSRLCEALEGRKDKVALRHLKQLFDFKSVTVLDCNEVLKICWTNANAKVAKVMWNYMDDREIKLNTFSVACLISALSRGGHLDEAMELLIMLGGSIKQVQPHIIFYSIFLNGCSHIGSISHAEECLRLIKENSIKEDELVYLELLKLAGRRKDMAAVQKAWALMVKICKPSMPTLDSYCAAVKALCQVGSFIEALMALREMVQLVSTEKTYSLLSQRKMRLKRIVKDDEIPQKEFTESVHTTEKLAEVDRLPCRCEPGIDEGVQILSCNTVQVSTTESSESRSEASKVGNAASTHGISIPIDSDLKGDTPLYTLEVESVDVAESPYRQLLGWTRLAMLNLQHSSNDSPESIQSVGSPISGFSSDKFAKVKILLRHAFNAIINAAVNRKDLYSAELLFSQMRAVDLKPDIYSYNAILRAVVRGRGLEHGFQVVKSMERHGLQPDTKTYNALLEGFCLNNELEKAEALLERMKESDKSQRPSDFSFNILLKTCGDADDLVRALRIFSRMVEAKVKPDRCTILYLLSAFGRVNAPYERGTEESKKELAQRLSAIESYMEIADMRHNFQTFNAVLVALSAEGMVDMVIQRLHLAEGRVGDDGLPILDTITFNTAINACVRDNQWAAAKEIFRRMNSLDFKPTTHTYNIMINGCAERKKIGDAFQYLDTMQEQGVEPTLSTYNTLIKVCCNCSELDAGMGLLKEMEESQIQASIITFNTLLASAVYQERLDLVEFLVEHMHREKIQPDITTCEHVVSAYLNCHQIDYAAEALRVLSTRMMLPKDGELPGQIEDILKQIFMEDGLHVESSTLQLLKDALISKGLISEALLAARLSGFGNAYMEAWNAESHWAIKLRKQYRRIYLE